MPHYHNVYWRLDFDLDGSENDAIDEYDSGSWNALTTETQRVNSPGTGRKWRLWDLASGSGYEVIPSLDDDVADTWSVADVWALAYNSFEFDDGGATEGSNGDKAHLNQYVTGESIDGQDVAFWYRSGFRHDAQAHHCHIVGPTLHPISLPGMPALSISDVTVTEGNAGTTNAVFTVNLSESFSRTVTVHYATANVTAMAGSDYIATAGILNFPAGSTSQTFSVAVNGDTNVETAETFGVNLSGAFNATVADGQAQATISNDDTVCLPIIGCLP